MVGGVVLLMSWWRFGSVLACVVVVGLTLGFLVASVVLFTPLGRKKTKTAKSVRNVRRLTTLSARQTFRKLCGPSSGDLDVFRRSDVVFWVTFCSITVVVPLFFVRWPREVN